MVAGADIVLLYGHFVPNEALKVFTDEAPDPSEFDKASWARFNFIIKISLPGSLFLRSEKV